MRFRLRYRSQSPVEIERHDCIAARTPLSGGHHIAGSLDAAFARLLLLSRLYPTNEVSASDRRQVAP